MISVSFSQKQEDAMASALENWGLSAQVDQVVEECAELVIALHKHVKRSPKPGTLDNVIDELADVEIMVAQMRVAFGIDDKAFQDRIERKFEKLNKYLETGEGFKPLGLVPEE
jgi:NTP pyrophosphatase (non-canonical NTP hydrolase)